MTANIEKVRLQTDTPIEGCELAPFVNASRDDGTPLGESEIEGLGIEWRWYRAADSKEAAAVAEAAAAAHISNEGAYRSSIRPNRARKLGTAEPDKAGAYSHSSSRGAPTCWLTGEPATLQYVGCPQLEIPKFFAAGMLDSFAGSTYERA